MKACLRKREEEILGFVPSTLKKQKNNTKFLHVVIIVFAILAFPFQLLAQEYNYEAESVILSNGAEVQNADACSGGKQVGYLGGNQNGTVSATVDVDQEGDYNLSLSYCAADSRSIYVSVNDNERVEVECPSSGGWGTPASIEIQVILESGQNTLVFDNPQGWSPNLDMFSLSLIPVYNIAGKVEKAGIGISGVTVSLVGAMFATVITDENGGYVFTNVLSGKNYTIRPASEGTVFSPPYLNIDSLDGDKNDQNFIGFDNCNDCVAKLSFGTVGEIRYYLKNGTFSVFDGDQKIIDQAYCIVRNGEEEINSMDYSSRIATVEDIADGFGSGKKLTISISVSSSVVMEQMFYAYPDHGYFMTEVFLEGEEVSSNYMAPLITNDANIYQIGDNRFLSVPFDNDAFIRYKSVAFHDLTQASSSEVTAFYDNESRFGLVVGSVEHETWKTGVQGEGAGGQLSLLSAWGGYTNYDVTRDLNPHGSISGQKIKSPKLFVGYYSDWRVGMEEYGQANAIAEPKYIFDWDKPTPFGWNSWGAIQADLSLDKAKAVVDFFVQSLPKFRNGETAYIDLDSFWDNMTDNDDYSPLIEFVTYCWRKGLKPGIYWGPFVDWGKWDNQVEGSTYNYASTWTKVKGEYHDFDGGRAMDPTHPATLARIKYLIDRLVSCGFEMIKLDFLGHATVEADSYYDPEVTTGMQAYRKGMEYLVDQLKGKMLVYAAISPNLATARYVHTRRIACDAFSNLDATGYTLNSNTYGWWQGQMYDFIDGDHIVFGTSSIGENHARLASGLINGTFINGDDFSTYGQWTERAVSLLQNEDILDVARDGKTFRPVEGNSESGSSEIFTKENEDGYDVIIVNYSDAKTYNLDFDRLGIDGSGFTVKELYSGETLESDGRSLSAKVAARDAVILHFSNDIASSVNNPAIEPDDQVYPNPTNDKVCIRMKSPMQTLYVCSIEGRILQKYEHVGLNEMDVDLGGYCGGLYLITVIKGDGQKITCKIVRK